jgi:hypothetical protein
MRPGVEWARAKQPHLKIPPTTGYAQAQTRAGGHHCEATHIIRRPHSGHELAAKIGEALDTNT